MTIALGVHSVGGLILAADTSVVGSDFSKSQGCKIETIKGKTGSYAIANAANDGNAASTLVSQLIADLEHNELNGLADLESIVADRMTRWASAHSSKPDVQLVLGAFVNRGDPPGLVGSMNEGGIGLYFCEPPNTIVRKREYDDSRGYVGIGTGSVVTDLIYRTLFDSMAPARVRLAQVCYMMYRAKKDTALCGGRTNAVIITGDADRYPIWITPTDTEKAEKLGNVFDFMQSTLSSAVFPQSDQSVEAFAEHLKKFIIDFGARFRELKFHSLEGDEIAFGEATPSTSQTSAGQQ